MKIKQFIDKIFGRRKKKSQTKYFSTEVVGKWENGKYTSTVTVTEMSLDELVAKIVSKF